MNGKWVGISLAAIGLIAGATIYYLQVYAYYEKVDLETVDLRLTSVVSGQPEPITVDNLQAIDANSSPLRFRACFTTPISIAMLSETFVKYEHADPLVSPGWFDCFDATEIGEALETGSAVAFLAQKDIREGIDRVVAVMADGRAFAWHQLNEKLRE